MKVEFERTFRVRHYECDAYEDAFYTSYLRYTQETAMDASASLGFDGPWYAERGTVWLVRDTEIEYLRPVRYGDSVVVKTWVENVRKVMSKRAYELRNSNSNEVVARAATDWAYLDVKTGKPARIPDEFTEMFLASGGGSANNNRERFPDPPAPAGRVFKQHRRVGWRDVDPAQHVNNTVYLAYAEDCAVEAAVSAGWTPERMRAEGVWLIARKHRIEYRQPAVLADDLEVATWVSDAGEDRFVRHYAITRIGDGVVLARARAELACIEPEKREAMPMPESLRNALID
ncbi:MAG: thioesterase family protein [Candidatus Hydrogenedentes bacterium]|nr:thioesterase family protein [Candidatus Hydrogenedentota bacterium]